MNANNGIINHLSPYAVTETIDRFAPCEPIGRTGHLRMLIGCARR